MKIYTVVDLICIICLTILFQSEHVYIIYLIIYSQLLTYRFNYIDSLDPAEIRPEISGFVWPSFSAETVARQVSVHGAIFELHMMHKSCEPWSLSDHMFIMNFMSLLVIGKNICDPHPDLLGTIDWCSTKWRKHPGFPVSGVAGCPFCTRLASNGFSKTEVAVAKARLVLRKELSETNLAARKSLLWRPLAMPATCWCGGT